MELSLLILVCIHKSYIVYLEIYVVAIGHGFSFFWSWKSHGNVEKEGHPVYFLFICLFVYLFICLFIHLFTYPFTHLFLFIC